MTVTGPDFIALQVSDLERSAEFPSITSWRRPLHHNADPLRGSRAPAWS